MKEPIARREPVPVDDDELPGKEDDEIIREPVRIVPPPPIEEDGWRHCARPGCNNRFEPMSRNPHSDSDSTEYYCSGQCAALEFYKKHGMYASRLESRVAEASPEGADSKTLDRSARETEKESRYGPLRDVVEVLSESKGGKRVKFSCGHQGSVAKFAKRGRCRVCKKAATPESPVSGERAEDQESPSSQERVKREPVARKTPVPKDAAKKKSPVKAKRRPVKSAKRPVKKKSR